MNHAQIKWADIIWNPIVGCYPVSEGCRNCNAQHITPQVIESQVDAPLWWREPKLVLVCSMCDLFYWRINKEILNIIWLIMADANQHTFMIVTKRPDRMNAWINGDIRELLDSRWNFSKKWPLPNVWLGVSIEDQSTADVRIPILFQTPATARFVSCEPLLGPINLKIDWIDWVIVGGETGPTARPMHPNWVRLLRDQCQTAKVPFFFNHWGKWKFSEPKITYEILSKNESLPSNPSDDYKPYVRVGEKKAGRLIDGQEWNQYPNNIKTKLNKGS